MILFEIEDFKSLDSLVIASPIYSQAFWRVHEEVLFTMLHNHYDGLVDIAESMAAVRSRGLYACEISNRDRIIALLDGRRRSGEIRQLNAASGEPLPDQPKNLHETITLICLHETAMFLLEEYSRTVSHPEWMEPHEWKSRVLPLQLSRTEKKRFFRAFYGLQTWCNIFGAIEMPPDANNPESTHVENGRWSWTANFRNGESWRLFFGPMAPWEVEEFVCLWEYCYERWVEPYTEVFEYLKKSQDIRIEVHTDAARAIMDAGDPAPFAQFEIEPITNLATLGPAFLVKILREQNFLSRLNLILDNADELAFSFDITFPRIFQQDLFGDALPLLYPAEKFNVGDDRDAFKEILQSLPPHKQPNLVWCQEWVEAEGDFRALFYDMFYCRNKIFGYWRWGYAFWDDDKVLAWGRKSI